MSAAHGRVEPLVGAAYTPVYDELFELFTDVDDEACCTGIFG
jgi:hypothetical protein